MNIEQALLSFTLVAGLLTITPGLDTALILRTAAVQGGKQSALIDSIDFNFVANNPLRG